MSDQDFEARISSRVDQVMAQYREALEAVGLQLVFRGIVSEEEDGTAEARIGVYEGPEWIDSLEFFVRRNHQQATSPEEVETWLSAQLERLVTDHPWGGGWEEV